MVENKVVESDVKGRKVEDKRGQNTVSSSTGGGQK